MMQFFVETIIVVFVSGGLGMAISFGFCALFNLLAHAAVLRRTAADVAVGCNFGRTAGYGGGAGGDVSGAAGGRHRSHRGTTLRGRWVAHVDDLHQPRNYAGSLDIAASQPHPQPTDHDRDRVGHRRSDVADCLRQRLSLRAGTRLRRLREERRDLLAGSRPASSPGASAPDAR